MSTDEILSLNEAVRRQARERPARVFVREVAGRELTYGACDAEASRWADYLAGLGIGAGHNVAVMAPTSASWVTAWMGINLLDARCVGVNTQYVGRMLEYILSQCRAEVVITARAYLQRVQEALGARDYVRQVVVLEDGAAALANDASYAGPIRPTPGREQVYGITYTSGTTGASKGVLTTWTGLYNLWLNGLPMDVLEEDDVLYAPYPMNHFGGSASVLCAAVVAGQVILRESWKTDAFWDDVRGYHATTTMLAGSMASFLRKQPPRSDDRDHPLRYASVTPVPEDIAGFEERFGLRVWSLFAMTETSTVISTELSPRVPGSCGRRRPGVELRVVDDEGVDCPTGHPGELWVRAADPLALMQGYYDMPEATAQAWVGDWFRTGDMLRCDEEGNYYFVDRKKDALRRRGENISSQEVEGGVNEHPAVLDSAVIAVPSEDAEDELMVVLELNQGASLEPAELCDFLVGRLPRFMIPQYIEVVAALPRTPATGRVRKQELRSTGVTEHTWIAPRRRQEKGPAPSDAGAPHGEDPAPGQEG